jgi:hypothetical protein
VDCVFSNPRSVLHRFTYLKYLQGVAVTEPIQLITFFERKQTRPCARMSNAEKRSAPEVVKKANTADDEENLEEEDDDLSKAGKEGKEGEDEEDGDDNENGEGGEEEQDVGKNVTQQDHHHRKCDTAPRNPQKM